MKEFTRDYPQFSLCGLNCGLCPRYQSAGASRCPGCGGEDFHLKHPSCPVITCGKKHGVGGYCFQCPDYPCPRYAAPSEKDSFITYRNVLRDMEKAAGGIEAYQTELDEKIAILEHLLSNYDDGRRKGFYCLAVNLLELPALREVLASLQAQDSPASSPKEKAAAAVALINETAAREKVDLTLRK